MTITVSTVSKGWIELWKLPRSRPANPVPLAAIARTSKRASDPGKVWLQRLRALMRRRTPDVTVNMLSRLTERVRQPATCFASVSFSARGAGGSAVGGRGAAGAGVRAISMTPPSLGGGWNGTVGAAGRRAIAAAAGMGEGRSGGGAVGTAAGTVRGAGGRVQRRPTPKAAARRMRNPAPRRALLGPALRGGGAPTNRRLPIRGFFAAFRSRSAN